MTPPPRYDIGVERERRDLRGSVDCPSLEQMELEPIRSEAIDFVAYDPLTRCLVVGFDERGTYRYGGVTPDVHAAMLGSRGPGVTFNEQVRGAFTYERIDD